MPPIVVNQSVHRTKDGRSFCIRRARVEDAAAVLRYIKAVCDEPGLAIRYSPGEFSMTVAEEEEFIRSHEGPNKLLLLATAGDEVIGSLGFQAPALARVRHAGAFGVSVAKGWRGVGVGSALIGRLVDWARRHPVIERVELEVFDTNPRAMRLYERFGFQEEGRRRGAIRLDGRRVDTIIMGLLLPPKTASGGDG